MIKKTKSTPPQMASKSLSLSASWILRGCKHPRTPSFSLDNKETNYVSDTDRGHDYVHGRDEATLSDVDRFLMENFKSLYIKERGDEDEDAGSSSSMSLTEDSHISLSVKSGITTDDLGPCSAPSATTTASASASASNGPWNTSKKTVDDTTEKNVTFHIAEEDFITVLRYSQNPYTDFKKSMQEIIEARLEREEKIDWEFMEELLFYYLKLNDKKSYRFILRAFVDLVVVLRRHSHSIPGKLLKLGSNPSRHDDL